MGAGGTGREVGLEGLIGDGKRGREKRGEF